MSTRDQLVQEYLVAKKQLQIAKDDEMALRRRLIGPMLEGKLEGTVTEVFGDIKVTATAKVNRTLDRAVLDAIWETLDDRAKGAIDFKPALRLADYRPLEEEGNLLMEAVTMKPGTPGIKVEAML
jgi:hypothetical protein